MKTRPGVVIGPWDLRFCNSYLKLRLEIHIPMLSSLDSFYYPAFFHQIHPYYPQLLRILSKDILNYTVKKPLFAGETKKA